MPGSVLRGGVRRRERRQGSGLKEKAKAAFQEPRFQRRGLRLFRAFLPNLRVPWKFITAYQNNGTAFVTRHDDVIEVLDRNADFEVVYEPRMRAITGGENFILGMQDTALYARDVSNMRLAVRRDDVAATVEPLARRLAEKLVAAKAGRIDVPPELSLPVPTAIVTDYFGVTGAPDSDFMEWATLMFGYLFTDLRGNPVLDSEALDAAAACRSVIDAAIAKRKLPARRPRHQDRGGKFSRPQNPQGHNGAGGKSLRHVRSAEAILKLLVTRPGLRRASGDAGQIDTGGTQFPKHFVVEWD